MTRRVRPPPSTQRDPRPVCNCEGRPGVRNPEAIGYHVDGCPMGSWLWRQSVRRQHAERGDPPPVFDEEAQRELGEAIRNTANAQLQRGMRDMQRLMAAAGMMQQRMEGMNVQGMSPQQLREALFNAAGGEANLRDLMSGRPAADIPADVTPVPTRRGGRRVR